MAQNIRKGTVKGFPEGQYTTALDGMDLYVKYIGPTDEDEDEDA